MKPSTFRTMLCARQISRVFREHATSAAAQQTIQKPTELGDAKIENELNEWTNAKPFDSIPGPKPGLVLGYYSHFLPKFGKYHDMKQVEVFISLNKEYGNIVRLRGLKTRKDVICCYDPKDIETIFRNEGPWPMRDVLHSIKYYRTQHRSELFPEYVGIFASDGEEWQKARSVLNPILMQPSVVSHYIPQMNSVGDDFIQRMRQLAARDPNGEMPETFQNEIAKWAIESVGVIALDCRFGMLDRNLSSKSEIQQMINDIVSFFSLLYKIDVVPNLSLLVSTPMWRKHMNTMDRICTYEHVVNVNSVPCLSIVRPQPIVLKLSVVAIHNFVQKELNKTMTRIKKEGNNDMSIVEKLLNIDPKTVFVNAMDIIIGGTDTTSRTMGNLLYLLAKHPDVQEKLREEVRRVLTTEQTAVTKEKLNNLPYLRAVIKESMRHTPIILSLVRKISKDLVLSGYQIPNGTDILLEQIPLAWNEKYFTDPKQFKPERWMRSTESKELKTNAWVFLPFGFGPRSCVGRRLASLELEALLAKVVRNFNLEWPHGEITYKYELVYGMDSPLKIRVTEVEE